jgi:glycosyltransferase involved in cell wall biosynthesis
MSSAKPSLTVITPTIGRACLDRQIEAIAAQEGGIEIFHLLIWDDYRSPEARSPESYNSSTRFSIVAPPGSGRNEAAPGGILRAIGLMAARTDLVTFADDDVWWEPDHAASLVECLAGGHRWGSSLRKIWTPDLQYLGVDRFESVGDDPSRVVPYEMCDNNVMVFERELGVHAAFRYRMTTEYNDDRLMYEFLKANAGPRGRTLRPTVNHICPDFLIEFFTDFCTA